MPELTLQAGKYYRTRRGDVVRVDFIHPGAEGMFAHPSAGRMQFPIYGSWKHMQFRWQKDGHWIGSEDHPFDIIEPTDPPIP